MSRTFKLLYLFRPPLIAFLIACVIAKNGVSEGAYFPPAIIISTPNSSFIQIMSSYMSSPYNLKSPYISVSMFMDAGSIFSGAIVFSFATTFRYAFSLILTFQDQRALRRHHKHPHVRHAAAPAGHRPKESHARAGNAARSAPSRPRSTFQSLHPARHRESSRTRLTGPQPRGCSFGDAAFAFLQMVGLFIGRLCSIRPDCALSLRQRAHGMTSAPGPEAAP